MTAPTSKKATLNANKRHPGLVFRILTTLFRMIVSPLLLLGNSLQPKKDLNRNWLWAFFLLITTLLILMGAGIWIAEIPPAQTVMWLNTITGKRQPPFNVPQSIAVVIEANALRNNLDPNLLYAIVNTESHFQAKVVSRAGARGMMQLMPAVWRQYSESTCSGEHDPWQRCDAVRCVYDPKANIRVGTSYFRELLNRYHGRLSLALEAYNAGMANVEPGTEPKFAETRAYIRKIIQSWHQLDLVVLNRQLQLAAFIGNCLKWLLAITACGWIVFLWWAVHKVAMTRTKDNTRKG